MYEFTGKWISWATDLFYDLWAKKSFIYWVLGTIIAIFFWYISSLFPYTSVINQSSSIFQIIGRLLQVFSIIVAVFALPILFYGIIWSVAKKAPKLFFLIAFCWFAYFLYNIWFIAYDIYLKQNTLPAEVVIPFFLFIWIEVLIFRKLIWCK